MKKRITIIADNKAYYCRLEAFSGWKAKINQSYGCNFIFEHWIPYMKFSYTFVQNWLKIRRKWQENQRKIYRKNIDKTPIKNAIWDEYDNNSIKLV